MALAERAEQKHGHSIMPTRYRVKYSKEDAAEYAHKLLSELFDIAIDKDEKTANRLVAMNMMFDRAWGKPVAPAELEIKTTPNKPVNEWTSAELMAQLGMTPKDVQSVDGQVIDGYCVQVER